MIEGCTSITKKMTKTKTDMAAKESTDDNQVVNRSYWRCTKQDFIPEEYFSSWKAYGNDLSQTRSHLIDRFLSRSEDDDELRELRKQSLNEMKHCLNWWDLMWFGFGSIIGPGSLCSRARRHGFRGSLWYCYVASGFSAMLSVFCYTECAVEILVAGKSFAYLRVELGDFASFIAAWNILLESIVGTPEPPTPFGYIPISWTR